jgi:DNA polymerase-3 subunit delta
MTLEQLEAAVAKRRFAPIYFFYGAEDFLIDEGVELIVSKAVDPAMKGFNVDVMYESKANAKEVVAHASAFPMMSDRRVVLVKEFEKLVSPDPAKEIMSAYIQRPLESTTLILISFQPDFRRKPFTDLKKLEEVIECKPLFDSKIPEWISGRIRKAKKKANPEACRLLHEYVGNSLRIIQSEIEKLLTFVADRPEITTEDVTAVVGATKGYTVFDLQNAIGSKDMRTASRILERMIQAGQSPQLIIVMLTRFFSQLWRMHDVKSKRGEDGRIASELGVNPYFVRQFIDYSSKYTSQEIEGCFQALLEADTVMKTTSRDPKIVLDLLLYSLIKGSRRSELTTA